MHMVISIHALREESDSSTVAVITRRVLFQSTPSARRATGISNGGLALSVISIHALREESDCWAAQKQRSRS